MKKRGFTLIELLAVIVVLAIIALIATPIVMNVIKKAGMGAAERSADNYVKAVETLIATEKLDGTPLVDGTYTIESDGTLKGNGKTYTVEVSGTKPVGGTITIKDGQVEKESSTISYTDYNVTYSEGKAEASEITGSAKPCALADGTANTVGAKYTCNLGETEDTKGLIFYVLEAGTSEKDASLIFERNYDATTQPWCATDIMNTCNADGLTSKLNEIKTAWTVLSPENVTLPTLEQIVLADNQTLNGSSTYKLTNTWLHGKYWTSSVDSNMAPTTAWGVSSDGCNWISTSGATWGVRPVITLPISEL